MSKNQVKFVELTSSQYYSIFCLKSNLLDGLAIIDTLFIDTTIPPSSGFHECAD